MLKSARTPTLSPPERRATLWLLGVLAVQLGCQVALLFETFVTFRVAFRSGAFVAGLVGLVFVSGRAVRHPSRAFAIAAIAIVALNILQPTTNTLLCGLAQTALYLAILAPLFWVTKLAVTPAVFARLVVAMWVWYTLSAAVGVLQVYFPGSLQPAISTNVRDTGEMAEGLKIILADGTSTWRPMGLTDSPGGAAPAGLFAFLFGMGYFVASDRWSVRIAGLAGMMIGLFCIYMCQIRSLLVMAGVSTITYAIVLSMSGLKGRAIRLTVAVPIVVLGSFTWAVSQGGKGVANRFETLVEDKAGTVYYQNRGLFLEDTVDVLLPKYPLGAGLGRW